MTGNGKGSTYSKRPPQLFFGFPWWGYICGQNKFLEIDCFTIVSVKNSKQVVNNHIGISYWQNTWMVPNESWPETEKVQLTRNVHLSFSSGSPEEVISVARTNSLKSIVPLLSRSKIRNRWSTITAGSSFGKILRYMLWRSTFRSTPAGHSFRKLLYHSLNKWKYWLNEKNWVIVFFWFIDSINFAYW